VPNISTKRNRPVRRRPPRNLSLAELIVWLEVPDCACKPRVRHVPGCPGGDCDCPFDLTPCEHVLSADFDDSVLTLEKWQQLLEIYSPEEYLPPSEDQ
jgi:hypothetical protein